MPRERDIARKVQSLLADVPPYTMRGGQDKFSDLAKRAMKQSAKKQHTAEMEGVKQEIASMPDKIGAFTNVNKRKAKRDLAERQDTMTRYGFGKIEGGVRIPTRVLEAVQGVLNSITTRLLIPALGSTTAVALTGTSPEVRDMGSTAQAGLTTLAAMATPVLTRLIMRQVEGVLDRAVEEGRIADEERDAAERQARGLAIREVAQLQNQGRAHFNVPAKSNTPVRMPRGEIDPIDREPFNDDDDVLVFIPKDKTLETIKPMPSNTGRRDGATAHLGALAQTAAAYGRPMTIKDFSNDLLPEGSVVSGKIKLVDEAPAAADNVAIAVGEGRRRRGGVSMSKKAFVKEHKNLIGVLKKGKRSELNAEARDQAAELKKMTGGCWECRGGGPIPDRNILQQIADQSYKDVPSNEVGSLELLRATPTLKFYKAPDNTIVVGIRGTKPTDADDVKADAMIGVGQLESAPRYTRDLQTLQQFQLTYPPSQYDYYGVGHSLGGAILDMFLKKGLIKNGVSYNPAVQPQDFSNETLPNSRVYMESDPLYALMGRNLKKKPETRAPRKKAWWEKAMSAIPYVGSTAAKTYDLYQSHMLDQFQGGSKPHSKFATQLKKVGIEPSLYLKEAQRRAKEAGLPYKLLGFADDGVHKLSIPNAEGQMRKFGAVGYGDHLIWTHLEETKRVPLGTADGHRDRFQKSHSKIKGDWKKDPFSPNSLALKVLW